MVPVTVGVYKKKSRSMVPSNGFLTCAYPSPGVATPSYPVIVYDVLGVKSCKMVRSPVALTVAPVLAR